MADCIRLSIPSYNYAVPDWYIESDDMITLDTDSGFSLRLTKQLEALSNLNNIKIDGVLGFSLPPTPKNDLLLRRYVMPNTADATFDGIDVNIQIGSRTVKQNKLFVLRYANKQYDIEIRNTVEHWIFGAKNLKLVDLDLGAKFDFTIANIFNYSSSGPEEYVDGDSGLRFPLAFYGGWFGKQREPILSDMRPWFSILYLLQKGYCQLGWKFRSTVLESDYGRRLIAYLLAEDFGQDAGTLESRKFAANKTTDEIWYGVFGPVRIPITKTIIFDNETEDTGNNYDNSTGKYSGACISDVTAKVKVRFKGESSGQFGNDIKPLTLRLKLMYAHPTLGQLEIGSIEKYCSSPEFNDDQTYEFYMELVVKDVELEPNASIYATFGGDGEFVQNLEVRAGSKFYNTPKRTYLRAGDSFYLQSLFDPNISLLDLTKATSHIFNGKFYTDWVNREVWLYPTYTTKHYNSEISNGYFLENSSIDITNAIQCDSEVIETPTNDITRYTTIKFKGDGDFFVKEKVGKDGQPLHSYTIDRGDKFGEDTTTLENPLFEATVNRLVDDVAVNNVAIDIPHMAESYDVEKPKVQFNIKPRILYWHGNHQQFQNGTFATVRMFNTDSYYIPYACQLSQANSAAGGYPFPNVIYGEDPANKDLYNYFYKKWMFETTENLSLELLMFLKQNEYFRYNFRESYTFKVLGRTVIGRLIEVRDFDTCNVTSTPIKLIPTKQSFSSCLDVPNSGNDLKCLTNKPVLIITKVGTCFNFSLGGVSTSPIATTTFEYKYINSSTWNSATSLCNPTGAFEVRMIVDYSDDCPTLTRIQYVDPCGNAPTVTPSYNYLLECVTFVTGGVNSSPILSIVIEYSIDNGVSWLPYTLNSCEPIAADSILWRATFTYDDGCPAILLEGSFVLPPDPPDCSQTNADVMCTDLAMFIRSGIVSGKVALDIIEYRAVGSSDPWQIWNEIDPVTPCPFDYRRVIFFCDDQCPTYCGPVHVCECDPCALLTVDVTGEEQNDLSWDLTATTTNCPGVTYDWYYDDGTGFVSLGLTTQTINVSDSGDYKCIVTCSNACTDEDILAVVVDCNVPLGTPINAAACNDD